MFELDPKGLEAPDVESARAWQVMRETVGRAIDSVGKHRALLIDRSSQR